MSSAGFLRAAEGEIRQRYEQDSAVQYIADALRMICENTANLSGGRYITASLADLLRDEYSYSCEQDPCSAEEVIEHIRAALRE